MAGLFLFFLALGAAGWKKTLEEASGHATVSEIAENTIEMISGHDVIVVDHKFEEHWLLLVGKWGIKAVLAVALIQSGLMLFRRQIRQWRFRKVSGHQVFVGLGGYNANLALREVDYSITRTTKKLGIGRVLYGKRLLDLCKRAALAGTPTPEPAPGHPEPQPGANDDQPQAVPERHAARAGKRA